MGKLILCKGHPSKKPFYAGSAMTKLYSVEELCYYVRTNIYQMEENFFTEELIEFLSEGCGLYEEAVRLAGLIKKGSTLSELVVCLLQSSNYDTEEEILETAQTLRELTTLPAWKRRKKKADELLATGNYAKARLEYERLLAHEEKMILKEEEYGDILHNIGVTHIMAGLPIQAAESFLAAYRRNHRGESLLCCLCAYKLAGEQKEYEELILAEEITKEQEEEIEQMMEQAKQEAKKTREWEALHQILDKKEERRKLVRLWKEDYRKNALL